MIRRKFPNVVKEGISYDDGRDVYPKKVNNRPQRRIALQKAGVKFEETNDGFIVNDKFFIAAQKRRWRRVGKWTWYWFKSIPDFVDKYVNN
jgi:hypothetical protein